MDASNCDTLCLHTLTTSSEMTAVLYGALSANIRLSTWLLLGAILELH